MDKDFLIIVRKIADKLVKKGLRLSIAESCTGGFISHAITNLPGSSQFFEMSVVCYSEASKRSVLGIRASLLKKHGTVSDETAVAMAKAVKLIGGTDVSLSTTGIAGPETVEGKDVGLVYMAAAVGDEIESQGLKLTGDRETIKRQASLAALTFLNRVLDIWL